MNYTYLKITLSLRKAGFDAVLLDYDWRRDIATLGKLLAERIAADGRDDVALIGHSMGGLVARAALTHAAGSASRSCMMLGTPNSGSLAAVQALRGTYSVVRKIAMLDLRHDAEFLARDVFASFPGLHELLPANKSVSDLDLFDAARGRPTGPGPMPRCCAPPPDSRSAWRRRTRASTWSSAATARPPPGVALRDGDFEYEYSLQGDGTVPIELARLPGARHSYVECGHSDMPLADRVIAGTIDLLDDRRDAALRRGAAAAARLADARARRGTARAVPGQDRLAAHDAGAAAAVPRHAQRAAARPRASAPAAAAARAAAHVRVRRRRRRQCARRGHRGRGVARRAGERRGRRRRPAPRRRDRRLAAAPRGERRRGSVTPIPRSLQRRGAQSAHRLSTRRPRPLRSPRPRRDRTRRRESRAFRRSAAVPLARDGRLGRGSGIAPADSFAAQLRGFLRARAAGQTGSRASTCTC